MTKTDIILLAIAGCVYGFAIIFILSMTKWCNNVLRSIKTEKSELENFNKQEVKE